MNPQVKTILLTILTLSAFTIALIELSGVSKTALVNKFSPGTHEPHTTATRDPQSDPKLEMMRSMNKTTMEIDTFHDFGTIKEGEKVSHKYHFKNTGDAPLLIANVVASCGCTIPSYPKEPILPGQEGDIEVLFNSRNKKGMQNKSVMIYSNGPVEAMPVKFKVMVEE